MLSTFSHDSKKSAGSSPILIKMQLSGQQLCNTRSYVVQLINGQHGSKLADSAALKKCYEYWLVHGWFMGPVSASKSLGTIYRTLFATDDLRIPNAFVDH